MRKRATGFNPQPHDKRKWYCQRNAPQSSAAQGPPPPLLVRVEMDLAMAACQTSAYLAAFFVWLAIGCIQRQQSRDGRAKALVEWNTALAALRRFAPKQWTPHIQTACKVGFLSIVKAKSGKKYIRRSGILHIGAILVAEGHLDPRKARPPVMLDAAVLFGGTIPDFRRAIAKANAQRDSAKAERADSHIHTPNATLAQRIGRSVRQQRRYLIDLTRKFVYINLPDPENPNREWRGTEAAAKLMATLLGPAHCAVRLASAYDPTVWGVRQQLPNHYSTEGLILGKIGATRRMMTELQRLAHLAREGESYKRTPQPGALTPVHITDEAEYYLETQAGVAGRRPQVST